MILKALNVVAACAALLFLTACNHQERLSEVSSNISAAETTQAMQKPAQTTEASEHNPANGKTEHAGLTAELFASALDGIDVTVSADSVAEAGTVNGQSYTLTINLLKWEKSTTPEQMVILSRLFWQCYPRMYARFADLSDAPTDVILAIDSECEDIASASGNHIDLLDRWLYENPEDYDCITHELAHVIQNEWDEAYLEDSSFIERFADCCMYSDDDTDILKNYFNVCRNQMIHSDQWDTAWQEIFSGTKLDGKTIGEVWTMFAESDFAYLSSYSDHGSGSELLEHYPVREKVRLRENIGG